MKHAVNSFIAVILIVTSIMVMSQDQQGGEEYIEDTDVCKELGTGSNTVTVNGLWKEDHLLVAKINQHNTVIRTLYQGFIPAPGLRRYWQVPTLCTKELVLIRVENVKYEPFEAKFLDDDDITITVTRSPR